jgi:predicted aldo/keto reductase-like oxidoreductase
LEKMRLGRTNMTVSRLGFGSIPIQRLGDDDALAVINRCLELGINFIDTANGYTTSEARIGRAISGRREGIFLATKSMARTREELKNHLQLSLQRLGVEYIDLYQFHQVGDFKTLDMVLEPDGLLGVLEEARKAGLIKHIGISSHQIDVAKAAVMSDRFDTIMFPFNFITCEAVDELLPLAREHDVGFIAMKPLAGGMLSNAPIAFKFLFQFPDVIPIPGIENTGEIEEIVQLLKGSHEMTAPEQEEMRRMRDELGTRFCRRCDYCQPCSQDIRISMVLSYPSFGTRMPPERLFSGMFAELMEKAGTCIECGECEERCPYQLPIREMVAEYFKLYDAEKKKYQQKA